MMDRKKEKVGFQIKDHQKADNSDDDQNTCSTRSSTPDSTCELNCNLPSSSGSTGSSRSYRSDRQQAIFNPLPLTEFQVREALEDSSSSVVKDCGLTSIWPLFVNLSTASLTSSPSSKINQIKDQLNSEDITTKSVFHYELMSLIEKRDVRPDCEPYDQTKPIDAKENHPKSGPALIMPELPAGSFQEAEVTFRVPHTEEVHTCSSCDGEGVHFCPTCKGYGKRRYSVIQKSAHPKAVSTKKTYPTSLFERPCYRCNLKGLIRCLSCEGVGQLKYFLVMTISRKKYHDHAYCGEAAVNLSKRRLKKVRGVIIKSEWGQRVSPMDDYPIGEIAQAASNLQEKHMSLAGKKGRIIEQRHSVEQIPVTVVNYGRKDQTTGRRKSSFFVYGKEREVFFPEESDNSKKKSTKSSLGFMRRSSKRADSTSSTEST